VEGPEVPRTPPNATRAALSNEVLRTPSLPDLTIMQKVDDALSPIRSRLNDFLSKADLWDLWSLPCDDQRVVEHLARLCIPSVDQKPCLLLHDLGGSVVEPRIVNGVFDRANACVYLLLKWPMSPN
jgi:hypothetical protein